MEREWGIKSILWIWLCRRWCGLGRCSIERHSTHTIERYSMMPRSSRTRTLSNRTGTVRESNAMLAIADRPSPSFQYVCAFISFPLIAFNGNYHKIRKIYFEEKCKKTNKFSIKIVMENMKSVHLQCMKSIESLWNLVSFAKIDFYFDRISTGKATNCNGFRNVAQKKKQEKIVNVKA